jgi:hypothetical protein
MSLNKKKQVETNTKSDLILDLLILLALTLVQGFYAQWINKVFYAHFGPFYDSMAYTSYLADVIEFTKSFGFLKGINHAINTSTVALPYLLVIPFSQYIEPSRSLGVWIQLPWVYLLLISCYSFIRKILLGSRPLSIILALPFTSIAGIYFYNGGLSDFRMDLQLYLLYSSAIIWFILALRFNKIRYWVYVGIISGLSGLARATAPMYLILTYAPILIIYFVNYKDRRKDILIAVIISSVLSLITCLWFFILRFKDLYYYYFVWNLDANAHLPISESIQHYRFAWGSLGYPVLLGIIIYVIIAFSWNQLNRYGIKLWICSFCWESIFAALIPAGFLACRGAGLNPFVSMPSTFGYLLFLTCLPANLSKLGKLKVLVIGVVILSACIISAKQGYDTHIKNPNPSWIYGYKSVLDTIRNDALSNKNQSQRITTVGMGQLCPGALENILIYDLGYRTSGNGKFKKDKSVFDLCKSHMYSLGTYVEWKTIKGSSDDERVRYLSDTANLEFDYLIIPNDSTINYYKKSLSYIFENSYVEWIKNTILRSGLWQQISSDIWISPCEGYIIYKKVSK